MTTKSPTNATLNAYEMRRAQNIERNNAQLRALGLISALEEEQSNALAWGKEVPPKTFLANKENSSSKTMGLKRRLQVEAKACNQTASRKSRRLLGENPDCESKGGVHLCINASKTPSSTRLELETRVQECREARQRAALEFSTKTGETLGQKNPTATYDHCLMRVRTMSEKALANRVRAIERAIGKHCVIKMAIFKSCLQDEGMWDLAMLATDALERLKSLEPLPPHSSE
jgi:hypothetical protein